MCVRVLDVINFSELNFIEKFFFAEKKKGTTGRSKMIGGWGLGSAVENRLLVGNVKH